MTALLQSPVEKLIEDVKDMGNNALWFTAGVVDFTTAEGLQVAKNLLNIGSLQLKGLQMGVDQLFMDVGIMGLMDQLIDRGRKYEPPIIEPIVDQQGFVNVAIVPVLIKAMDPGGQDLTYDDNGTLPLGLTLNTATTPPQIQGAPDISALYTSPHVVRITVRNPFGMDTTVTFLWAIGIAAPDVAIPDQTGTVGTAITSLTLATFANDFGGFTPLAYAITGLPPGLTMTNGVIDGEPTTAGTYRVDVTVTNTQGKATLDTFFWVISTP